MSKQIHLVVDGHDGRIMGAYSKESLARDRIRRIARNKKMAIEAIGKREYTLYVGTTPVTGLWIKPIQLQTKRRPGNGKK